MASSAPTRRQRVCRRFALVALVGLTGLAGLIVVAVDASAQVIGMPSLERMPHADWDVEQRDLSNVISRDLRKAYRQGVRDLKKGNCRHATSKFEFILEHIDDDPAVYYVAATAARCTRGFRTAAGYYESAIQFEPTYYDAHKFLGLSRLALGELDAATEVLGTLELMRIDCAESCEPAREEAYTGLRGALQIARAHLQEE